MESSLPDYTTELEKCRDFLTKFKPSAGDFRGKFKYRDMLESIADRTTKLYRIEVDDVIEFSPGDSGLARGIISNSRRYVELFSEALETMLEDVVPPDNAIRSEDVTDVLMAHRKQKLDQLAAAGEATEALEAKLPSRLTRRFEVRFTPPTGGDIKPLTLRNVKSSDIGHLVTVKGIATRVSDVKPLITVMTYTCDVCGFEVYQNVNGKSFTPLKECPSTQCKSNKTIGRLHMQTRGSRLVKYQEIKVQEMPDQVPVGHIPRAMTVIARGELTREVLPGDILEIDGVFTPTPYSGFKAIRAGLIADTYLEVHRVRKMKKSFEEANVAAESRHDVEELARDPNVYNKLASSIAPEIYGHEDVKKALLLQLISGVTLTRVDGIKIRGDINICLMGDPGVAKSQLLKHIAHVAPRGVYTTGKGSSGVGLTAAVIKDPITGEMMLEGGALVLADTGICCIDEFDKMEDTDRTAIHEVMEQQTVSIAKAGIMTTLNARTSVLAAANPLYGRYNPRAAADPHTALLRNVNLPAALLSRFDLLFLILDKPDVETDRQLAEHVTYVHQKGVHPPLEFEPLLPTFIRAYVAQAREFKPYIPPELSSTIVEQYVDLRRSDAEQAQEGRTILTPRQLLSILRLSQAVARLHFMTEVNEDHVREAVRLVEASKASIVTVKESSAPADPTSQIFEAIRAKFNAEHSISLKFSAVQELITRKGFSLQQLDAAIAAYADINVWSLNPSRTKLTLAGDSK